MFVKSLIGSHAGTVFDLRHDAAQHGLGAGTHVIATDEEIKNAGFEPPRSAKAANPEKFPDGYFAELAESGGYMLFRGNPAEKQRDVVRDQPFPNLAAARDFANGVVTEIELRQEGADGMSAGEKQAEGDMEVAEDAGSDLKSKKKK